MLCVFNGVISYLKIKTNIIPNIEHSKLARISESVSASELLQEYYQ